MASKFYTRIHVVPFQRKSQRNGWIFGKTKIKCSRINNLGNKKARFKLASLIKQQANKQARITGSFCFIFVQSIARSLA